MSAMTFRDVVDSTGALRIAGDLDMPVTGVCTDTRELEPGNLYVALSGPRFDGNLFANEALEKGAGALLLRGEGRAPVSDFFRGESGTRTGRPPVVELIERVPVCVHPDPQRALADLASWWRDQIPCPVVGITGSCGKTTTKDVLAQLLADQIDVVSSPRSFNNQIGVPLTVLRATPESKALVCEVGTNAPGEIASLCRIVRPTGGIITNIGAAHLEGLGSLEGVAAEKADLAASIGREGFVVLNADCRFTPYVQSVTSARVITFSVEGDGDLDARDLVFHAGGTTFRLAGREVTTPLLGTHGVQNVLAALAACVGLGFELDDVLPSVSALAGGRQRMERHELGEITLFDDSWNSNPTSARAVIRVLAGLHGHARRVLVLGDMLELGRFAAELHHQIGMEAARAGIDLFVPVGELARAAAAGALEGGMDARRVVHLESTDDALERVPNLLERGDVVLVKGSRGMQLERLVRLLVAGGGRAGPVGPQRLRA